LRDLRGKRARISERTTGRGMKVRGVVVPVTGTEQHVDESNIATAPETESAQD
jgi:hypothetical protein